MFTPEEITRINHLLSEGVAPEKIGESYGMILSSFRNKLARSGYRIRIYRELEAIPTVQPLAIHTTP